MISRRRVSAIPGIVQIFSPRFSRSYVCFACRKLPTQTPHQPSRLVASLYPRLRSSFSSLNARTLQEQGTVPGSNGKDVASSGNQLQRRKLARSPAANSSLRRVAVEAQRSRSNILSRTQLLEKGLGEVKVLFNMDLEIVLCADSGSDCHGLCGRRPIQYIESQRYTTGERL